jgi:hypothetical protein
MFGSWLGGSGGCQSKDELSSALIDLSEEIMAQVGHPFLNLDLEFTFEKYVCGMLHMRLCCRVQCR